MDLHLILISIIEGLTEFLPVSSTGHMILAAKLMRIDLADSYVKFYLLFIQLGALLAGVALFARRLLTSREMLVNVVVSFIPTAIIGLVLYKLFKHLLEGNMPLLAAVMLAGGIALIYLERIFMKRRSPDGTDASFGKDIISKKDALIIGLAQAVAIVPGVSRSGATIVAGILRGIKKSVIIEYTFTLALPTLGAATVYDLYKSRDIISSLHSYGDLIGGFVVSALVGAATLYALKAYLPRLSLSVFGWYRIVLGLAMLVFLL